MNEIKESPAISSLKKIFEKREKKKEEEEKNRQKLKDFLEEMERVIKENVGIDTEAIEEVEIEFKNGVILFFRKGEWLFKERLFWGKEELCKNGSIVTSRPKQILELIQHTEVVNIKIIKTTPEGEKEEEYLSIYL